MAKISTLEELLGLPDAEEMAEVYTITGLGTVKLRPLNRDEHAKMAADCRQSGEWDEARWECLLVVHCSVEPAFTYDQAAKLRRKKAGIMVDLCTLCARISGLTERGEISREAVDNAEATFQPESDQV